MPLPRLYTPEEVATEIGHVSPYTIRNLVAQKLIPCVRGAHGAVLFTEELVKEMLDRLTVWPELAEQYALDEEIELEEDNPFNFSTRSMKRHRSASLRRQIPTGH